jgi:hypothetical protein
MLAPKNAAGVDQPEFLPHAKDSLAVRGLAS